MQNFGKLMYDQIGLTKKDGEVKKREGDIPHMVRLARVNFILKRKEEK